MNIKGFFVNPLPQSKATEKVSGQLKMQESADRDADGRRQPQEEETKQHLSDEEFKHALESLEKHPGLIANNLTIKVEENGDQKVVFIEDSQGNVVRRLSERQLWSAIQALDRKSGSILDKAI